MSISQNAPIGDKPGQPTDTGEFVSQQNVELGYVSVLTNQIMPRLGQYYIPEYEDAGVRKHTVWRRGGIPGASLVNEGNAASQPNWFVGEQFLEINTAPQTIVFARAPAPIRFGPPPAIGPTRSGYRAIYNAMVTLTTRILAFDDDDGWELMNFLVAAAWRETVGSNNDMAPVADNLIIAPKTASNRGSQFTFFLMIGVPIFMPPLAPACVERVTQQRSLYVPGKPRDPADQ